MDKEPKGVPPVTPKSVKRQTLERWEKADTGGDPYDRSRQQYSKNAPKKDLDFGDEI